MYYLLLSYGLQCTICYYHMVYNVLSAIIIWFTMYYMLLSYGLQCTICYYHMVYNVLYALIIWFTMYYMLYCTKYQGNLNEKKMIL